MTELQLSYSSIKDYEVLSPFEWKEKWIDRKFPRETKRVFTFGSLLDCLLFEPETFNTRFIVHQDTMPTDTVCDLVSAVVDYNRSQNFVFTPDQELSHFEEIVLQQIKLRNYYNNRKPETNLKSILKDGSSFFKTANSTVKLVVSQKDVDKVIRMRENIWNHPETRKFVIPDEGIELEFQKTLKLPYREVTDITVNLKCIFDGLRADHKAKTKQIFDLKSTASSSTFSKSVDKYRYGAQVGLYCYTLFRDEQSKGSDYEILPPVNVIVDKTTEQPSIYTYNWLDLKKERWGYEFTKGWHGIIREIAERYKTNDWL